MASEADGGAKVMSSTTATSAAKPQLAEIDVPGLRKLSEDVVARVSRLRELLEARAAALEECRVSLDTYYAEVAAQSQQLAQREKEICAQFDARESELTQRE